MQAPPEGHASAAQAARALIFIPIMYVLLLAMGLVALPTAVVSRRAALWWTQSYCRIVLWLARVICGIRSEVRGEVPQGPCIVASKHQSFLDVIMLTAALPRPRFVMKRSLLWVPVLGYFARRIGSVAIDRSAGRDAIRGIVEGVSAHAADRGQTIIFPEGTRVRPGVRVRYKGGVLKLYTATGLPVALAAVNTGWFWPRIGTRRTPGTAVVEFVETIPAGAPVETLMHRIETAMEAAGDRLSAEAAADIATRSAGTGS